MPLVRSAGLAGVATLASRILGLARDQVLAALFGAGNDMDAFIVAFRIPNLVRDLFAEGAMSAAFVPTFTRYLTRRGREQAWRLGSNLITALLLVTAVLVGLGLVFADSLVGLYAADYARVPGKLQLTIDLTRVMLPFLTLVALAAAAMGMLNSLQHYFLPALAPAMFNVATIAGAFALVPVMRAVGWPPIMAVALSTIAGGAGQVAIQWPSLRREGFRYRMLLDFRDPGLRQILLLMGPGTIGLAATQVNLLVNTLLATTEGTGAVSWLTYAFRVMYLPIGLFGVSIGTAVLPLVSQHAATDDRVGIRDAVSKGLSLMLMLNVPATVALMTLATPIVQLLLEHGRFEASDTAATARALQLYAVGLIGYSATRIVSPTFYALRESRTPVIVSIGAVATNIVFSFTLVKLMGFRGLALSTSLAALVNGGILTLVLRQRLNGIDGGRLFRAFVKVSLASAVMAVVAGAVAYRGELIIGTGFTRLAVRVTLSIGSGLGALALAAKVLNIQEFEETATLIRAWLWRTRREMP